MTEIDKVFSDVRVIHDKLSWLNRSKMENALAGYTASEVHLLEYIGKNENINVTKLAEHFFMTRGAMSKSTKKLIKKGALQSKQKEGNKKEIYFTLTEEGQRVFDLHEQLHQEFRARDQDVLNSITPETLSEVESFLQRYNDHLSKEIQKKKLKTR